MGEKKPINLADDINRLTSEIIGAAFEVANILRHGFLEIVYRRALARELRLRGLSVAEEVLYNVAYKGEIVGKYRSDLIVEQQVVVEVKATQSLVPADTGQTLNYLRTADRNVGLLFNFGRPRLQYQRVVL